MAAELREQDGAVHWELLPTRQRLHGAGTNRLSLAAKENKPAMPSETKGMMSVQKVQQRSIERSMTSMFD